MLKSFWWLPIGKVPEIKPEEFDAWLKNDKQVQVVDRARPWNTSKAPSDRQSIPR